MKTILSICLLAGVMSATPVAHATEPLGRLFFTPEQRMQLDQQNRRQPRGNVRINGYLLTLPSGKATAWVDGKPMSTHSPQEALQLDADDDEVSSVTVTTQRGVKARARVGDDIDTDTGAVQSNDPARIRRGSPAAK